MKILPIFFSTIRSYSRLNAGQRDHFAIGRYPTPSRDYNRALQCNINPEARIELFKDNIQYLGEWRTHLFFLSLIGYYKTSRVIEADKTIIQHGCGNAAHEVDACHPALISNFLDTKPGMLLSWTKPMPSIYSQSFFHHWLGMTVCCPLLSNRVVDRFFEGGGGSLSEYRRRLLLVMNLVSQGKYEPIIGLHIYFQIMMQACQHYEKTLQREAPAQQKTLQRILILQQQGMFQHANNDGMPNLPIIERILDKNPCESREQAYFRLGNILREGDINSAYCLLERFQQLNRPSNPIYLLTKR